MSADAPHQGEGAAADTPAGAAALISQFNHALRTPLNTILGYAQILALDRVEPLSAVQRERVEKLQQAGWELVRLLDTLVEQARAGSKPPGDPA